MPARGPRWDPACHGAKQKAESGKRSTPPTPTSGRYRGRSWSPGTKPDRSSKRRAARRRDARRSLAPRGSRLKTFYSAHAPSESDTHLLCPETAASQLHPTHPAPRVSPPPVPALAQKPTAFHAPRPSARGHRQRTLGEPGRREETGKASAGRKDGAGFVQSGRGRLLTTARPTEPRAMDRRAKKDVCFRGGKDALTKK